MSFFKNYIAKKAAGHTSIVDKKLHIKKYSRDTGALDSTSIHELSQAELQEMIDDANTTIAVCDQDILELTQLKTDTL